MKKYSIILTAIITCTVVAGCYNPSFAGGPCHEITGQCTGSLICTVIRNRHVCSVQGDGAEGSACGTTTPCGAGFRCVLQGGSSICLATENRPGGVCAPGISTCPEDYPCTRNNGSFTCSPPAIGSITWREQELSGTGNYYINDVHYYDGTWILAATCGRVYASTNADITNGTSFREVATGSTCASADSSSLRTIHQNGPIWRIGGEIDAGILQCDGNCTTSAATSHWTAEDIQAGFENVTDIYSWGDHWVALTTLAVSPNPTGAPNDRGRIAIYDDADEMPGWTVYNIGDVASTEDGLNAVHYGDGNWVAVGAQGDAVVYTSPDNMIKTSWTLYDDNDRVGEGVLNDVYYSGTKWVAVGSAGTITTSTVAEDDTFNWMVVADDDITTNDNLANVVLQDVHYDDETWIAVGTGGTILQSTNDGASWISRTSGDITNNNLNAVYYAPGTWVAVGDAGTIITSTDGTDWIAVNSSTEDESITASLRDVHYGGGIWVIVGGDNLPVVLAQYTPNFATSIQ